MTMLTGYTTHQYTQRSTWVFKTCNAVLFSFCKAHMWCSLSNSQMPNPLLVQNKFECLHFFWMHSNNSEHILIILSLKYSVNVQYILHMVKREILLHKITYLTPFKIYWTGTKSFQCIQNKFHISKLFSTSR